MTIGKLIGTCSAFWQLHRELQTYTDVELAELGLTRRDAARIAFAAAIGTPRYGPAQRASASQIWRSISTPCRSPEAVR